MLYLGLFIDGRGLDPADGGDRAGGRTRVLVMAGYGVEEQHFRRVAATPAARRPDPLRRRRRARPRSCRCIAAADVSAMPVQGDTLNHRLNTPTKLFDAMGAGVPGGRQRPAGHGARSSARPAAASCAIPTIPRTSLAPSGSSSTRPRSAAPPTARPAWRRRVASTPGSARQSAARPLPRVCGSRLTRSYIAQDLLR